jgi:hypothetical protein
MSFRLRQRLWRDRIAGQEVRNLRLDLEFNVSFLNGHLISHSEFLNKSLHINKFRPGLRSIRIRSLDRSIRILEKEVHGVNKKEVPRLHS